MTPRPPDAWTLARLLSGQPVNGELQAVSDPFRPLAEHLAGLATADRAGAFEAFLCGRPDREAIRAALAHADPEGPQPEAESQEEGDGADDWGPIRIGAMPTAEPFPLDVLPKPARDLAEAAARSIGCPVDFPAVGILAAASGLIGRSASLRIKSGHFASCSLYAALVGGASSGKSPSLGASLAPLWKIADECGEAWKAEKTAWKARPEDERGEPPELTRIVTTDPTTEALAPILQANPRGLTVAPDEMTKWISSMDQYKGGKGGDRSFYLSVWDNRPVHVDRAKNAREPIIVPHPYVCVVGGMTPDMLGTMPDGKGREDGFMARVLFCFPERAPQRRYSKQGVSDAVADAWHALAASLWARPMRERDGRPSPHVVLMTTEAADEWERWCNAHYAEQEGDDFPDSMEGPWGKLEAYAARLALILHLMDLAADPTVPAPDEPPELRRRFIVDAARLAAYFKSHASRVYAQMSGGKSRGCGDDAAALIRWILRNELSVFSMRDAARNLPRFKDDPGSLGDALVWMTGHNLIRPDPENEPPGKTRGRKRSPAFDVNPALGTSPRFRQYRRNSPEGGQSVVSGDNAAHSREEES